MSSAYVARFYDDYSMVIADKVAKRDLSSLTHIGNGLRLLCSAPNTPQNVAAELLEMCRESYLIVLSLNKRGSTRKK